MVLAMGFRVLAIDIKAVDCFFEVLLKLFASPFYEPIEKSGGKHSLNYFKFTLGHSFFLYMLRISCALLVQFCRLKKV